MIGPSGIIRGELGEVTLNLIDGLHKEGFVISDASVIVPRSSPAARASGAYLERILAFCDWQSMAGA